MMPRRMMLALWASLGLLTFAAAQEFDRPDPGLPPPPLPPCPLPRDAVHPPQPVSLPNTPSNWQYAAPTDPSPGANVPCYRIHHLRQAADHLEAAGLTEQARELRKQADLGALLAEKRALVRKLQAEIDELSKATPASEAALVQLKMHVLEVVHGALPPDDGTADLLKQLLAPSPAKTAQGNASFEMALQRPGEVERVLAKVRKSGAIKVLAEPTILTVSGQAASFSSGAEFPVFVTAGKDAVAVEYKRAGVQIDVLPVLCKDGFLRLEVRPRVTTIDEKGAVHGGFAVPRLRTREFDVGVELRFGQSLVLSLLPADEKEDRHLVVVVTPTLLEGRAIPTVPPTSAARAAAKPRDSWWDRMWFK